MPEVTVDIGGRSFTLLCEDGEEAELAEAAKYIDVEATSLQSQTGRLTESKMLLMAGLMLADRYKQIERQARNSSERIKHLENQLHASESRIASLNAVAPKVFPQDKELIKSCDQSIDRLEELAKKISDS